MSAVRLPRAAPLALVGLVGLVLAAGLGPVPASAAPPPASAQPVVYNFLLYDQPPSDFGISPPGIQLDPGTNVTFHVVNWANSTSPHDLYVDVGGALAKTIEQIPPGGEDNITFTVPAKGIITYYCNIPGHKDLGMQGNLTVTGSAPVAPSKTGPTPAEIRVLGVNFYAYWVGVASFIILFVVLAATFFLLRYGETKHWTDQRDRPARDKGEAAASRPTGTYVVFGLAVLLLILAAVEVVRIV
jgi:plastocyanin